MSEVANPVVSRTVDGGYSGTLTVEVSTARDQRPPRLFIRSDPMDSWFVLSMSEAEDLGLALGAAVAEAKHVLDL